MQDAGWTMALNDSRQIAVLGSNYGVLLTPTPEPRTLGLLAAGATCRVGYGLRQVRLKPCCGPSSYSFMTKQRTAKSLLSKS